MADINLDLMTLRNANVRRCAEVYQPLDEWDLSDYAAMMAGECGEACNEIKKMRRGHRLHKHLDSLADELADTVVAVDLLAARAGINLAAAIRDKFNRKSEEKDSSIKL